MHSQINKESEYYQESIVKAAQSFAIVFEGNVSNSVLKVGNGEELIQVGCPSKSCTLDFLCKVEPLGLLVVLFISRFYYFFLPFFSHSVNTAFVSFSFVVKSDNGIEKRRRCRKRKSTCTFPCRQRFTYRSFKVAQSRQDDSNVEMDLGGVCNGLQLWKG